MIQQVIFHCNTCEYFNKDLHGTHGFRDRKTDFESFSEAWNHMKEDDIHHMIAKIIEVKS